MWNAEVVDTNVSSQKGNKNGKDWEIRKQVVYVSLPWEKFPLKVEAQLRKQAAPYPVGKYRLDPSCFKLNNFGDRIEVEIRSLLPPLAAPVGPAKA